MLHWVTLTQKDGVCFGAAAFRAWADDIENGKYDVEKDMYTDYGVYMIALATNSVAAPIFLDQIKRTHPEFAEMAEKIKRQYIKMGSGEGGVWKELEDIGGGFNVTPDNLRDKEKRANIAAKIRKAAECTDEVMQILQEYL